MKFLVKICVFLMITSSCFAGTELYLDNDNPSFKYDKEAEIKPKVDTTFNKKITTTDNKNIHFQLSNGNKKAQVI